MKEKKFSQIFTMEQKLINKNFIPKKFITYKKVNESHLAVLFKLPRHIASPLSDSLHLSFVMGQEIEEKKMNSNKMGSRTSHKSEKEKRSSHLFK